jgi:hypothetical protein
MEMVGVLMHQPPAEIGITLRTPSFLGALQYPALLPGKRWSQLLISPRA